MRLSLVPSADGSPVRPPAGWLFPSADPEAILGALARLGVNTLSARFFELPVGRFVIPAGAVAGQVPAGAIPYGHLAGNVFAPIEAMPTAEVSAAEWEALFPLGEIFVWHPAEGLFAVAATDLLGAVDLLLPPPVDAADWSRAIPGLAFNGRIVSLLPERSLSLDDVWGDAAGSIGAAPISMAALPPLPGEWSWPGIGAGWSSRSRWLVAAVLSIVAAAVVAWSLASGRREAPPTSGPAGPDGAPWGAIAFLLAIALAAVIGIGLWRARRAGPDDGAGGRDGASAKRAVFGLPPGWLVGLVVPALVLLAVAALRGDPAVFRGLVFGLSYAFAFATFILFLVWLEGGGVRFMADGATSAGSQGGTASPRGSGIQRRPLWGDPPRWVLRWQKSLARAFESRHERATRRLLHLLATDPDAGLRFAVPLVGEPGRGIAPPADGLFERRVDYGAAAGGAPAFFIVSQEHRAALAARYRELANREIDLGRHRRSAYVFAHLLGDFPAAAAVLRDGGHFREAAALYEKKLGKPAEAAEALERGGHFAEAILLYARVGDHEKVGHLAAALGQEEEAAAAFRRAVDRRVITGDRLAAARILTERLGAEEEALDVLAGGWPASPQARACVTELLRRLGSLGRHGRARDVIRTITDDAGADGERTNALLAILPPLARDYPDESTRREAADRTRRLAADLLGRTPVRDVKRIMAAVAALEPGDRLLARDTRRFPSLGLPEGREKPPVRRTPWKLSLRAAYTLPEIGRWTSLVRIGGTVGAAGARGGRAAFVRVLPSGTFQVASRLSWSVIDYGRSAVEVLVAVEPRLGRVVLHSPFRFAIDWEERFAAGEGERPLRIGSHPAFATEGIPPCVVGMGYSGAGTFDVVRCSLGPGDAGEWVWARYDAATDAFQGSWRLPDLGIPGGQVPPTLFRGDKVWIGLGTDLFTHSMDRTIRFVSLPQPVVRLAASASDAPLRIVASYAEGGELLLGDSEDARRVPFGAGLAEPRCCLLESGFLVAAAAGTVECYDVRQGTAVLVVTQADRGLDPVAIVPMGSDGFAILERDGTVTLGELTR